MKSYTKEFVYTDRLGKKKTQKVFVMNETADIIEGIQFKALPRKQRKQVAIDLANHEVRPYATVKGMNKGRTTEGMNTDYYHAWRKFKKERISAEENTVNGLAQIIVDAGLTASIASAKNGIYRAIKTGRKTFGYSVERIEGTKAIRFSK